MKLWASLSRVSATREPAVACRLLRSAVYRSWPLPITPLRKHSIALSESLPDDDGSISAEPSASSREQPSVTIDSKQSQQATFKERISARAPSSNEPTKPRPSVWESVAKADARAPSWARIIVELLNSGNTVIDKEALSLHHNKSPAWIWLASAHWLLEHDFRNLLRMLKATHSQAYVPPHYIDDFLLAVAQTRFDLREDAPELLQHLADVFCIICERDLSRRIKVRLGRFAWSLVQACSIEQSVQMFHVVKSHGVDLHWASFLHFADYLTKNDRFEDGLDALLKAHEAGALVNEHPFRSCCSTVLRRSIEQPEGLRVCLRIVSTLVELGLEMNNTISNIIMLNAVEAGDLNTTFSVYHLVKQRGLRPTEGTIAALLKGCKMKIDDVNMLNETIRDAVEHLNVRKSELVACEILHCLALHHAKHHPETALETVTEAYAQFFQLDPLMKLGLPIPKIEQPVGEYLAPNQNALNIMIGVSIEQRLINQPYDEGVLPLYQRWRHLVESGDTCCVNLATTDYTANIFLMAFMKRIEGLVHATRVVHDMQSVLPPTAGVEQAKPTVQTWSIFLHGFSRHKKTQMAESVLRSMRSVGMEPNAVTWNSLLSGYAKAQDEEGALATVRRALESGMVWDEWTHGGLRALQKRERVQEELARGSVSKEMSADDQTFTP